MGNTEKAIDEKRGDAFVDRWHSVYFIVPVFENPPRMPEMDGFLQALSEKFGEIQPLSDTPRMPKKPEELLGVALWDHQALFEKEDKRVPSQLVLYGPDVFERNMWDEGIIAQFWDCEGERGEFADRCRYAVMASNMMAAMLPQEEQYQIMADYADLLLEQFPDCIGIYWPHSQRLVPREHSLKPHWHDSRLHFLDGGLHVRFFNITGSDEMLFDTLGLTAIGLPDLQCHCRDIEPGEVVMFLRNMAAYLYREGDIIEDGNTVEGIDHDRWVCRREDAMAAPMRVVLDICPGRYAGGGR